MRAMRKIYRAAQLALNKAAQLGLNQAAIDQSKRLLATEIQGKQQSNKFSNGIINNENEHYLWTLYELMGECLEFLLKMPISDNENAKYHNELGATQVQTVLDILMAREQQLTPKTEVDILESLIDSFRIIANQLYKQSCSNQQIVLQAIAKGPQIQIKRVVLAKITLNHFNESDNESAYSDESFNPAVRRENSIKKASKIHGLVWYLKNEQVQAMRERLRNIQNAEIRQKLVRSIEDALQQQTNQIQMISRKCELLRVESNGKKEISQQMGKNYQPQNRSEKWHCQKTENKANNSKIADHTQNFGGWQQGRQI